MELSDSALSKSSMTCAVRPATRPPWQASSTAYAAQWLPVRNVLRPTNRDDQWLVLQRRNP